MRDHGRPRRTGGAGRRRVYHAEGASGQANQEGEWMRMRADERSTRGKGKERSLLFCNRSRPEDDGSIATSKLWPRFAAPQVPSDASVDADRRAQRREPNFPRRVGPTQVARTTLVPSVDPTKAQRGETNPQTSCSKAAWPMVDFRWNSSWFERLYRKLPEVYSTRSRVHRTRNLTAQEITSSGRHCLLPLERFHRTRTRGSYHAE